MKQDDLVLISVLTILLNAALFFFLIQAASGAKTRKRQLKIQNRILLYIAKKIEVDPEKVEELNKLNNSL